MCMLAAPCRCPPAPPQNVVATVNLNCKLNLKDIALHARNAEYNPKRFAAVIMRIREPKSTALIFASGKMVVTGAKSENEARLAARKYARILQKLNYPVTFKEFKIQNMVGSCDVKFPIRLEGLAGTHALFSSVSLCQGCGCSLLFSGRWGATGAVGRSNRSRLGSW